MHHGSESHAFRHWGFSSRSEKPKTASELGECGDGVSWVLTGVGETCRSARGCGEPDPDTVRSIGDCHDNCQMESFWARMPVESLYRKRGDIRPELANAIFE
jgi:hypothetical protein